MNKFFSKKFIRREDGSVYLQNAEEVLHYDKVMTERLLECRTDEALLAVKSDVLSDYRKICDYDIKYAEFPKPLGEFDSAKSQGKFVRNRILLHDFGLYPGNIFFQFHCGIYNRAGELPSIELKNSVINYNELYSRACRIIYLQLRTIALMLYRQVLYCRPL